MQTVQRDEQDSGENVTSTEVNVSNYRDLCRQIYSQLPTTCTLEVFFPGSEQ